MTGKRLRCAQAQERLQDLHDGGQNPAGSSAGPELQQHLRRCRRCRRFAAFLAAFPAALREELDQGIAARTAEPAGGEQRLRAGRAGHPALRWAVAAAGLLVAAGLTLGTVDRYRTVRGVRGEVTRLVERLYAEPLLADAESALRRARGGLSEYLEAYGAGALDWLEQPARTGLPN